MGAFLTRPERDVPSAHAVYAPATPSATLAENPMAQDRCIERVLARHPAYGSYPERSDISSAVVPHGAAAVGWGPADCRLVRCGSLDPCSRLRPDQHQLGEDDRFRGGESGSERLATVHRYSVCQSRSRLSR